MLEVCDDEDADGAASETLSTARSWRHAMPSAAAKLLMLAADGCKPLRGNEGSARGIGPGVETGISGGFRTKDDMRASSGPDALGRVGVAVCEPLGSTAPSALARVGGCIFASPETAGGGAALITPPACNDVG